MQLPRAEQGVYECFCKTTNNNVRDVSEMLGLWNNSVLHLQKGLKLR